ncbi:hypothetical protein CROQUDRAFT_660039 [Cronartium quercuum f. sp. fusiforme G11]|uniref:BTB domain-containing protein n=1 Tax=Cronartium quercuum f. sp. fusiforme G11 TaxID=708437 RepID=A0A9P6T9U7_9BASI|nr:hypothetical protein CROQUDRAFT_660039 [Cronartium quercuum f. sp. fusiforme G11]
MTSPSSHPQPGSSTSTTPSFNRPNSISRPFQFIPNHHQLINYNLNQHQHHQHHSSISSTSAASLFNQSNSLNYSNSPPNRSLYNNLLPHPSHRVPLYSSSSSSRLQSNRPSPVPTPPNVLIPQPQSQNPTLLNNLQSEWFDRPDSRSSTNTTLPQSRNNIIKPIIPYKNFHIWNEEWPRQWGWTGVDIPVHGVKALRDEIETKFNPSQLDPNIITDGINNNADESNGSNEVVNCSFASDRWKVEIVKAHTRRASAPTTPTTTLNPNTNNQNHNDNDNNSSDNLSLYLTCHELEVDWPTSRSISTSILISIKEPRIPLNLNPITDLGSVSEGWIWRVCCDERSFERESEVWECHTFPSLSKLLENSRVALYDSFIITIQIATPSTVSIPQLPQSSYIPHSLLQGLESLIDDQNTSDLQILVNEYETPISMNENEINNQKPKYRKRLLYAHSGILKSRSEYFRAMLGDENGGWAESGNIIGKDNQANNSNHFNRKLGLVKIEDFDFNCVYWLLRWLYSNRIFFVDQEDVRSECYLGSTLTQAAYPSSTEESKPITWGWCSYNLETETAEGSVTGSSGDHLETVSESGILPNVNGTPRVASSTRGRVVGGSNRRNTSLAGISAASSRSTPPTSHSRGQSGTSATQSFSKLTHSTNPKPSDSPTRRQSTTTTNTTEENPWLIGEPHSHPVTIPTKASALSIYRLAHRYELIALQELAMTHLISNLTPSTAFPLLLASFVFPELHCEIKAYCLANYYAILQEPEFSRCYAEVGEGLWEHGGEVLLSFTMSLMPGPNPAWYA